MNAAGRLILMCSLIALAPVPALATQASAASAAAQQSAHDRLFALFHASDEANLKRNPLQALFRGDMRYADHLGDLVSDAHYQAEKAAALGGPAPWLRPRTSRTSRRFRRSRAASSAPPTRSPMTRSSSRRRTRFGGFSPTFCR